MEQVVLRHRRVYYFLRVLLGWIFRDIHGYSCDPVMLGDKPCLILANHVAELDPVLMALSFREHMYFVASEHIFRKGFVSWLLTSFIGPIARVKGTTDATAALSIIRAIKKGSNVCLFAEGNRCYNGVTGPIFPATGKLAKATGAALVTYRFVGGYLTSPRWANSIRKGQMRGAMVRIYTPEELKQMTPEEVNAHIREDIWEDAFERQKQKPLRYRGKELAKGLENALYFCPKCGKTGTLHGEGDIFRCSCGYRVRFTETGFFEKVDPNDEDVLFTTVRDWDAWQNGRVAEYAAGLRDDEIAYADENVKLFGVSGKRHRERVLEIGRLSISKTELCIGTHVFPLQKIHSMGLMGVYKIMFSVDGASYELRTAKTLYCGRKYLTFFDQLRAEEESDA